jgi:ribosome recycling factor
MSNPVEDNAKILMQKAVETFQADLAKIRTGRAHPSLLEHLMVSNYGSDTPLSRVASINVLDSRTLSISPWDKNLVQAIEKAIMTANLGLNPTTAGQVIRVPLPPLTEERRKQMAKLVKQESENAKVVVRNIRRDANNDVKEQLKAKKIPEDEARRTEEHIQKLTDKSIGEIEKLAHKKEAELMEL